MQAAAVPSSNVASRFLSTLFMGASTDHDDTDVDADPTAGGQGVQCGGYGSRGCAADGLGAL